MARKPAHTAITLAAIVAAGENGTFAPEAEISTFAAEGLVEVNANAVDAHGNIAVRATAAGIAKVTAEGNAPASTPKPTFATVAVPADILTQAKEKKRAGRKSGEKYPFETLELNEGFFVPVSDKMPEPAKSLASTISTAVSRYSVEETDANGNTVMEAVTVKDYQLDEDGKRVKDAEGHWIVTAERQESRPKMVPTRVFRAVEAEGGAWVVRIQ